MPEREVGCTGRMEVRRSTIRTGKWAHKTMGDERRPVEKGERRKSQDAGQVGTLLKRQPSVGRCSGGGRSQQRRQIQSRSRRGPGCAGDVPRRAISRERGCLVGGLRRWEGVERSGRRTEERWLPRVLGRARLACDGRDRSTHGQQRRRGELRGAELRAGRIFFSSFGGFWLPDFPAFASAVGLGTRAYGRLCYGPEGAGIA